MQPWLSDHSRRDFLRRLGALGISYAAFPGPGRLAAADLPAAPRAVVGFPGPWQFLLPKGGIILVSDQQLEDLQDPDKTVDLSLSSTPHQTTLRKVCEQTRAMGGRTIVLAFDEFWTQYRPGQKGRPRELLPDTDDYVRCLAKISETVKTFGLGLELSLLSPLEIGRGYRRATGETGRWVQYREGYRDPKTGRYTVALWEQRRWTNNKGGFDLERVGVRVFAFRENRIGGNLYAVNPAEIVELKTAPEIDSDESAVGPTRARRLVIRGQSDEQVGPLDRVLAVVSYHTPEMDYFSPKAAPFLENLLTKYHAAGVPLNGLYADEMHIQQDWSYGSHHDEGEFTMRYLTPNLARRYAELYGEQYGDFEKFLVYFCYAQHGFRPDLEARLPAQHLLGNTPEDVQRTFLLRRRYYELLHTTVVQLFASAKRFAERKYGHELEARAHATWAESPTCDFRTGTGPLAPRQYDYTPDFLWSNTVQQAAAACDDYFDWNDFLTGGGNDHAEGGWSDRDYFGIALACSTGILNRVPYAYAAAWGMPQAALERHQAVCDVFGASASPWFQAAQDSQHRDIEVLFLYPMSLVSCEERFGSWMAQYGYANYVTAARLLAQGRLGADGKIEMAGRRFGTLAALFEPLPPPELLPLLERFAAAGGKIIWSGPPPRIDFAGSEVLTAWRKLFGVSSLKFGLEGLQAAGHDVEFSGTLKTVPPQLVLTDFLVDYIYPVEPGGETEVVAKVGDRVVGLHRATGAGSVTYLGFRPRDDQAASLGREVRTWFEVLNAVGAYPSSAPGLPANDNPAFVSRNTGQVACRFPNGAVAVGVHYRSHVESWPGGFHRDPEKDKEILARNPLPPGGLELRDFRVAGHKVDYHGQLAMCFRVGADQRLAAFAGYQCKEVTVDGRRHVFAAEPMALIAWAPVAPERRVPGGATLELWAQGAGEVMIPLPVGTRTGKVFLQGASPGSTGAEVPCSCAGEVLRFKCEGSWGRAHAYFLPGSA